jgi:hypothetical protein
MARLPDHWNQHARQWQWIGPPLRPVPEDIAVLERAVARKHAARALTTTSALLLGVTAEIAAMNWPPGARLIAVDHSLGMIEGLWRGDVTGYPALCAEWTRLPLADASQDVIVGDGCFSTLLYPRGYEAMVRELRRVLNGAGMLALRFYVRPEMGELLEAVFDDLKAGCIGNFHVFKWRLAMALHGTLEQGVKLADIWQAWHEHVPDRDALAASLGWRIEVARTIDVYRDVATRYTFPTLAEVRTALSPAFVEADCVVPHYELGERCPTLIFARR